MVAVLQYTTIIKIGAQRAQRSLFAQPNKYLNLLLMWQSCTETKVDRKMMPNLKTIFDKNGLSVSGAVRPTLITAFAFFYNTDSSLMFTGC